MATTTSLMMARRCRMLLSSSSSRILTAGQRRASSSFVRIHDSVQNALQCHNPVVALESTIVAHGMPYPENLYLSKRVASLLRERGVEPATIAVKDGICRVGLTMDELEDLARAGEEGRAKKCSTRELSLLVAQHRASIAEAKDAKDTDSTSTPAVSQWGATTVASTMKLAHIAGISTFVTGGIGGVHRHGEVSMDISADLTELSRTPVIVVSAGIKSILDIPRTLEVLETNGVPTVAYQTDEFPAFFSPHSGVTAPARVNDARQVAEAYLAAQELGLTHGMLVAVPNEDPAGANVEYAIQSALTQAEERGIRGQDVTPFILKTVAEMTKGDSLRSNMALVERNAVVGADIAIAIAEQSKNQTSESSGQTTTEPNNTDTAEAVPQSRVVVLGGVVLDLVAKPVKGQKLTLHTSNPATCKESDGGVARNVAEVLGRLGSSPLLYSAVGNDSRANAMLGRLSEECGVPATKATVRTVKGANTATYIAVLDEKGDLHTACADMDVLNHIEPPPQEVLANAEILVMDANPPVEVLHQTALYACRAGTKVFFEPTSVTKALKVSSDDSLMSCLTYASPNMDELSAMADGWSSTADDHDVLEHDDDLSLLRPLATRVIERMNPLGACLVVTCGANGVLLASKESRQSEVMFRRFQAPKGIQVENATGAGDTLSGAFIHALLNGKTDAEAVQFGIEAATKSLQSMDRTISPDLK